MDYRISLVGLFIGFLVGLTGMGGGSLLAPIMILFFRIPPVWAVGTDIAYSTVTKALGSVIHIRQKNVNFKVALWLACGSVPATLLSVGLVQYIRKHYGTVVNGVILHALGFTLVLVAVMLVLKPFIMRYFDQRRLEKQKQEAVSGEIDNDRQDTCGNHRRQHACKGRRLGKPQAAPGRRRNGIFPERHYHQGGQRAAPPRRVRCR